MYTCACEWIHVTVVLIQWVLGVHVQGEREAEVTKGYSEHELNIL